GRPPRRGSGRLREELGRILQARRVVAEELLAADPHLLAELARAFALVEHDPGCACGGEDPEKQEPARPRGALRLQHHPGQRSLGTLNRVPSAARPSCTENTAWQRLHSISTVSSWQFRSCPTRTRYAGRGRPARRTFRRSDRRS